MREASPSPRAMRSPPGLRLRLRQIHGKRGMSRLNISRGEERGMGVALLGVYAGKSYWLLAPATLSKVRTGNYGEVRWDEMVSYGGCEKAASMAQGAARSAQREIMHHTLLHTGMISAADPIRPAGTPGQPA